MDSDLEARKQERQVRLLRWKNSRRHLVDTKNARSSPKPRPSFTSLDEESPWSKKTVLSLDGGGVRGLSTLYILRHIMHKVGELEREKNNFATSSAYSPLFGPPPAESLSTPGEDGTQTRRYLPCHYFDYIGGTSTGALIAIMLGRLRMDVYEAIKEYKELSKHVFEKPSTRLKRLLHKYSSAARRQTLSTRFKDLAFRPAEQGPSEDRAQFKSDPERCRTIVCTVKGVTNDGNNASQEPFLFRSYDHHTTPSSPVTFMESRTVDEDGEKIWEVARAASAAPSFFKSVRENKNMFYDAVVNLNNPSWELYNEVSSFRSGFYNNVDLLLSIGGSNAGSEKPGSVVRGGALLNNLESYSEFVDRRIRAESGRLEFSYYRLDVKGISPHVGLNEWKPKDTGKTTLKIIEKATEEYLSRREIATCCQVIAEKLVERRISRSSTMRWESFATSTRYKCHLPDCKRSRSTVFLHRNAFLDHLRIDHNKAPPDTDHYKEIQTLLEQGRTDSG